MGEIADLIAAALGAADLDAGRIACAATIDRRGREPAIMEAAQRLGVPLRLFSAAELEAQTPHLQNPSEAVFRAIGCHGVAESAALAAAGAGAHLLIGKTSRGRATCALAAAAGEAIGRV